MNLPNKLTVLRVLMSPLFLIVLLWNFPFHYVVAALVFGAAAFTDMLDGRIARKQNLITNLGKFLDPLADKMLTTAAFLGLLAMGYLNVWAVMIILIREFTVMSVRLVVAGDGTVLAASFAGKAKTVAQFVSILYMLVALEFANMKNMLTMIPPSVFDIALIIGQIFIWISVALTVISGFQYFYAYRNYFFEKK